MPPAALPDYAELHCRSNYSFLTGASHPAELVQRAVQLGYSALAITDECSLAGVVRAHAAAKDQPIRLVIGSEMLLSPEHPVPVPLLPEETAACHAGVPLPLQVPTRLLLLARTRRGYSTLSQWITLARGRAPKGQYLAHPGDVEGKVADAPFLAGLPDCQALLLPQPGQGLDTLLAQARWLQAWFHDRAGIAVELLHRPGEDERVAQLLQVQQATGLPLVAAGDVLMHVRSRKPLQDVLTATRLNRPLADCGLALAPNAEQYLRSRARLAALYPAEWLANSLRFIQHCRFSLNELKYQYPDEIVPAGRTPAEHLRALTEAGLLYRYPQGLPDPVRSQVDHELALITQLGYEAYFLTVADIVAWAREQGILCQGRGSAANSAVCFALRITEINPQQVTLLFERFISAERGEPPDIDVDFEHQRREEVIQHIYKKYGRHRAALTAVVICYRPRSALRDVGRALGFALPQIDALAKSQQWFDGNQVDPQRLQALGLDPQDRRIALWLELSLQLIGFPRHLSQHPGGFVIAQDRLADLVPIEKASMADRSVVQWDKDDLDELRMIKVDVLALGMLSALRRGLQLLADKLGVGRPIDMAELPADDEPTYNMVCAADTVGVFQIESRAQMGMLPRLRPRGYYDLVVEVAIVRPGPIQGGMVHPYLRRRAGLEPVVYPGPGAEIALARTLGVPIFQEQVMQLAVEAAKFSRGDADKLRRAMAAWKRHGDMGPWKNKLMAGLTGNGYTEDYALRLYEQIKGFGEYGFPESHAASFALLVYVSSWLKCHHPDAFLAALLNSQPMGFYAPAQLVRDARAHGVEVLPVDVCCSEAESGLVPPATGLPAKCKPPVITRWGQGQPLWPVRLGLDRVAGLSAAAAQRIVAARAEQAFADVADLARRAELDRPALDCLAAADALVALAGHRHQAAWTVAGTVTRPGPLLRPALGQDSPLAPEQLSPPSEAETLLADYRALHLTLHRHPLALLREQLDAFQVQPASVLRGYPHGRPARASGLVTHRQRPPTAKGTVFVTLEDDSGAVNVIVWPRVAQAQRQALLGAQLLTVFGQWQREGDVMNLVASRLVDHTPLLRGLLSRSRDFR